MKHRRILPAPLQQGRKSEPSSTLANTHNTHHRLNAEVATAYVELLTRVRWDWICHLTYATPVHAAEKVERDVEAWIRGQAFARALELEEAWTTESERRDAYGRLVDSRTRWRGPFPKAWSKGRHRIPYVLGIEEHRSGALHGHVIVSWPAYYGEVSRQAAWSDWFERHGQARVEPVRCQEGAAAYVSKAVAYAVKRGEIIISDAVSAPRIVC